MTETPQEDNLYRVVASEVRNINNLNAQQIYKQALEREVSETLNGEEQARMTSNEDIQYCVDLSSRIAVHQKTPQEDNEDDNATRYKQVISLNNTAGLRAHTICIVEVLTTLITAPKRWNAIKLLQKNS